MTIVLAVLSSSVVAGLIGTMLGNVRANAALRRDRYAQAVRCLVAWIEYPYRIRRRTDDQPATLAALAERGHVLQEQIAESAAWVAAESRTLSEVFDQCARDIGALVGPACQQAWLSAPAAKSADMNLGPHFGPRGVSQIVTRMQCAIVYRFGLRRLMWRRWVMWRLSQRGCLSRTDPYEPRRRTPSPPRGEPAPKP